MSSHIGAYDNHNGREIVIITTKMKILLRNSSENKLLELKIIKVYRFPVNQLNITVNFERNVLTMTEINGF